MEGPDQGVRLRRACARVAAPGRAEKRANDTLGRSAEPRPGDRARDRGLGRGAMGLSTGQRVQRPQWMVVS